MLGYWRPHAEYQEYLVEGAARIYANDPEAIERHKDGLAKAYTLDLDPLKELLSGLYSKTGTPARDQPELLRSIILMSEYRVESVPEWRSMLLTDPVLRLIVGLPKEKLHGIASYYDITDRLWGATREKNSGERQKTRRPRKKPRSKPGKGEKLPLRRPGIVQKLVDKALEGRTLEERPERVMQMIFAKTAVEPAAEEGLFGDVHDIPVSGDGTCVGTGGASKGIKVCDCRRNGVYKCDCNRRFSDVDARWGYDSYRNVFYYGHCLYALTHYNEELKTDIPIYVRMVQAQRHDSVSAIIACSEFWELYPGMEIGAFIGDSAHDNLPTYRLFHELNIDAVIALNGRSAPEASGIKTDPDGTPICIAGHNMVNWGLCPDRGRTKYRCPLACGKIDSCDKKPECSESPYGRTVYTHPDMNLRLFTSIPRGSDEWKKLMNSRTSSERYNKRNALDYDMKNTRIRGKKRIFMRVVANTINIVLDARLKKSQFDFIAMLKDLAAKAA